MKTELSDAWKQEARRRCREIDEGTVRLVEAEEAFARAQGIPIWRLVQD